MKFHLHTSDNGFRLQGISTPAGPEGNEERISKGGYEIAPPLTELKPNTTYQGRPLSNE